MIVTDGQHVWMYCDFSSCKGYVIKLCLVNISRDVSFWCQSGVVYLCRRYTHPSASSTTGGCDHRPIHTLCISHTHTFSNTHTLSHSLTHTLAVSELSALVFVKFEMSKNRNRNLHPLCRVVPLAVHCTYFFQHRTTWMLSTPGSSSCLACQ